MNATWAVVALSVALASDPDAVGDTRVTVYVRGAPSDYQVQAQRGEEAPVVLYDRGSGVLSGDFHGPPARFLPLRIVGVSATGDRAPLYDGLVVLADTDHERVGFQYGANKQLLRAPLAPSARMEIAFDERVTWWVTFGWGAFSVAWLGVLGVMWTIRSR